MFKNIKMDEETNNYFIMSFIQIITILTVYFGGVLGIEFFNGVFGYVISAMHLFFAIAMMLGILGYLKQGSMDEVTKEKVLERKDSLEANLYPFYMGSIIIIAFNVGWYGISVFALINFFFGMIGRRKMKNEFREEGQM